MRMTVSRSWLRLGGIAVIAVFAAVSLAVGTAREAGWDPFWIVIEFLAASVASASAARTAGRCSASRRRAWIWLSAGAAAWALGEAWWAMQQLLIGHAVGVPSPADLGFLLLPPCAAAGLLVHPAARAVRVSERVRLLLDAGTITVALMLVAWQFPIAAVLDPNTGTLTEAVSLAYPISDTLLAAILFTLLAYGASGRRHAHLTWLLAGLLALTGADSVFVSLTSAGSPDVSSIADVLWTAGFVAFAVAAAVEPGGGDRDSAPDRPSHSWLPDTLLTCAILLIVARWLSGVNIDRMTVVLVASMVVLVYVRQFILMRERHRLATTVHDGREQLRHVASHDALTGLPNRAGFLELVEDALQRAEGLPIAVVKFRPAHPHLLDNLHPGDRDEVLSGVAARISASLRPGDHLARVSEVTFAAVVSGDAGIAFAQQITADARAEASIERRQSHVALIAGIALTSETIPAATLVQQAGIALNSAAESPDDIALFTASMLRAEEVHLEQRESVARALRAESSPDLQVVFEPVTELSSGRLAGMAARISLRGDIDSVSAGRINALARESGMAERLDDLVLVRAITRFATWTLRWPAVCDRVWIGICGETLANPGFPSRLQGVLHEAGLAPHALVLEPMGRAEGRAAGEAAKLNARVLRGLGVRLVSSDSMDLSGYASRPDAGQSEADYFDISPVLVERCGSDIRARRLVQATTEFAASQHAETSARQVSTVEQHDELVQAGCELGRGPLYGTPRPADEAEAMLEAVQSEAIVTPARQLARRHRASQAWQELRTVISSLPIAAFACAPDGTLVLAEGALLGRLAITSDIIGRPLTDLVSGEPADDSEHSLQAALQTTFEGSPAVCTVVAHERSLQVYLCPGLDEHGAVTGALGVVIDVTHRAQAERALRNSEQRFKAIFAAAPVGMAIVTPDSHLLEVNPALASMLGYEPDELAGRSLTSIWHEDTPTDTTDQYDAFRAGRISGYHAERAYRHRDGSPVWARVTVGSLADEHAVGSTVAIVEDITSVKQLEVELRHAQKLEAVGMLAAGIAHEVNTPTQFVGDNLTFLADGFGQLTRTLTEFQRLCRPVDETAGTELADLVEEVDLPWLLDEIPDAIQQSLAGVTRVAAIVGAMRNFGHPDSRDPSAIDIDAAIRDTAVVSRNEYKYVADMCLELGDVPTVLGFPSEFNQVMLNLIVNAAHAIAEFRSGTNERGTIRVRTWFDDEAVHVAVTDDGCGMPAETRARIFDPFFTTKAVGRGTGQGLSIAHNVIVERHHGAIDVDTAPGEGSTFTLHLPRPVADAYEPIQPARVAAG